MVAMIPSIFQTEDKDDIPPPETDNFPLKPPKPCPLCPRYPYQYKNFWGLVRHIQRDHLVGPNGKILPWSDKDKVAFLREYDQRYVPKRDIPVKSYSHVEKILYYYAKGEWNPSLRGLE